MRQLQCTTEGQHPLWQLTLMRWRIFAREPAAIFWTYAFPLLLALALGIAFRNRPPEPVEVGVQAAPGAEVCRDALAKNPAVHVHWLEAGAAYDSLRLGKVSIVVVAGPPRTYEFDPTRPESRIARAVADDALQRAEGRTDPTQVKDQLVTEPGSRYIDFLIPGLLGFNLMSSGLWGVGFVLVEMRVRKLIKRMTATPMSRVDFLLSFVLVRAVFLLGELPLLLAFAYWVFEVPIRGSLWLVVALSALGSLVFAGMGLLVGCRAQNTQTAAGLVNLVSLPMAICSGVFFSSARFPELVQPVIKALPLTALIEGVRGVMLGGAGLAAVAQHIAILLVWGAVSFAIALRLFRWQ
ncbi:MAG: ABC transporter permease [Verrucomicrobia bacterium]|nr:ABC transporter permease [Verrucomicrobiota bacterium]